MDILDSGSEAGQVVGETLDEVQPLDWEATRRRADVSNRKDLSDFAGQCVGDDVSWVGTAWTRFIALQSGTTGGDRKEWGAFWGTGLRQLGADVGMVAETRMYEAGAQAAACSGMLAAGYLGICHGVAARGQGSGLGNGVLLAVRSAYVRSWDLVERDVDGRGIAGNLEGTTGLCIHVVGVYGITGASLPGFDNQQQNRDVEERLVEFVRKQRRSWSPTKRQTRVVLCFVLVVHAWTVLALWFFLTSCVTLYFEQEVPQPLGDFSMQLPGNYMVASSSTSLENPWLSKRQCARYRVRMPMLVLMYVHCDHLARIGIDNSLALKRFWDMSYGMHPPGIQYEIEGRGVQAPYLCVQAL